MEPCHQEIFDLVLVLLMGTQAKKTHYSGLCVMMKNHANSKLTSIKYVSSPPFSHRDISATLHWMVKHNYLKKDDDGRRGTKVIYELTPDTIDSYRKGILDKDPKLRKLYQLLLFFECVTNFKPILKSELDKALYFVNATEGDLVQESNTRTLGSNETQITYKNRGPLKVQKIGLRRKDGSMDWYYYIKQDGLTVEEVTKFLKSTGESNHFLIGDLKYKRTDIDNGIEQLITFGLLRYETSYDGNLRYHINDDFVQEMIHKLYHIHDIELLYISTEWKYRKPTKQEKDGLESLVGKQESQSIINRALIRRKKMSTNDRTDIAKENLVYSKVVDHLISNFFKEYGNIVNESHLYSDMIKSVIIRPLDSWLCHNQKQG